MNNESESLSLIALKKLRAGAVNTGPIRGKLSNPLSARSAGLFPARVSFPQVGLPCQAPSLFEESVTLKHVDVKKERFRAPMCELTFAEIRARLALGELQHDIAADLGINQGRVSEVNTGKRGDPNQMSLL